MKSQINAWNSLYEGEGNREKEPQEEVGWLREHFKTNKVHKILDMGCGGGRHLIYFSKLGYDVSGLDVAPEAIKLARKWLAEEGLTAELECADMIQLPWQNDFFDAVLSIKVIEHNLFSHILKIMKQVYRVLADGGFFLAVVKKYPPRKDWKKGNFTQIDHHLYAPTEGPEKDIIHYFFTADELRDILADFTMIKIEEDKERKHHCALVKKS